MSPPQFCPVVWHVPHDPPTHVPLQQSGSIVHAAPVAAHCASPHVPFVQSPLQHWLLVVQRAPFRLHDAHVPALHPGHVAPHVVALSAAESVAPSVAWLASPASAFPFVSSASDGASNEQCSVAKSGAITRSERTDGTSSSRARVLAQIVAAKRTHHVVRRFPGNETVHCVEKRIGSRWSLS